MYIILVDIQMLVLDYFLDFLLLFYFPFQGGYFNAFTLLNKD